MACMPILTLAYGYTSNFLAVMNLHSLSTLWSLSSLSFQIRLVSAPNTWIVQLSRINFNIYDWQVFLSFPSLSHIALSQGNNLPFEGKKLQDHQCLSYKSKLKQIHLLNSINGTNNLSALDHITQWDPTRMGQGEVVGAVTAFFSFFLDLPSLIKSCFL